MNLQIRDPRAHALAKRLAERRNTSITDAVVYALETQLKHDSQRMPLAKRLATIADDLAAMSQPGGRDLTKAEIDDMWGSP